MAKGPLRLAIEDFVETSPPSNWWKAYRAAFMNRAEELTTLFNTVWPINNVREGIWMTYFLGLGWIYLILGFRPALDILKTVAHPPTPAQLADTIQTKIASTFSQPEIADIAEAIGSLVTDPVMSLFEQYAGDDTSDPKDFARAFHGLMTGITTTGAISDFLAESLSAGAIKAVGNMVQNVYWNLGLGFLGWQTMAPILSAGLQPGLTRYYQKLYRPMRFSASELRDLYALGEITDLQLKAQAQFLGWRDADINTWIRLSFRTLGTGDIWQAWHEGRMTTDQATVRLRALGYDPKDIPLLFDLNPAPEEKTTKDVSASTARAAYQEGLISGDDLRGYLRILKYKSAEIELIIDLEDLQRETAAKRLTVSQIKSAWTNNVLTDPEAKHWLALAGFPTDQVAILLETWQNEIAPVFVKVNLGTIIGAYVTHIFTRLQAHDRLVAIGLADGDATLELDLAERRNPEAFQPPAPPIPKTLTPGVLAELVFYGLMTPDQMKARLKDLGYTDADAGLLAEAARIKALPTPKPLPQASIANAYVAGIINRTTAAGLLVTLGYNSANAAIVLDTLEANNPQAFGAPPPERIKTLSEGTLVDLNVAGVITDLALAARLADLGYPQADIDLILARVALLKAPVVRVLTQGTVERAYIVGVLNRSQAKDKLIALQFTAEDAEKVLTTVEAENPAVFSPDLIQSVRLPTIAALVGAVQKGLITPDEYIARTAEIGYNPDDAFLYLALAYKEERKSVVQLNPSQIVAAYNKGLVTFSQARTDLTQRGYSDDDATLLLRTTKDLVVNTEAWYSLLTGALDVWSTIQQLVNAHYADTDILEAFSGLPPAFLSALEIDLTELKSALAALPGGR